MKKIQIVDGYCHYDMTEAFKKYDLSRVTSIVVVDAPDYVFPGWGYDEEQEGDSRFIKPTPPDGWLYDDETGTFYEEGAEEKLTQLDMIEAQVTYTAMMTDTLLEADV